MPGIARRLSLIPPSFRGGSLGLRPNAKEPARAGSFRVLLQLQQLSGAHSSARAQQHYATTVRVKLKLEGVTLTLRGGLQHLG